MRRGSDNATSDVGLAPGTRFADAAAQDAFCAGAACVIVRIYDQSPRGNHLGIGPGGGAAPATDLPVCVRTPPLICAGENERVHR